MKEEKRALKRRHLIFYLEVLDHQTEEYVGHVADITTKGIMLVSKKPIATGKNFKFRMMLPEDFGEDDHLIFTARSVWSKKDINPDFYATGFEVPELTSTATAYISNLIEQMGFND